jgi:transposase
MSNFRLVDRLTPYLLPPSLDEWLPQDHLARFIVEVVEGLDLKLIQTSYAGRGKEAYHPAMMLSLLIYGYATGIFSSRKIERATYDSVAFRFITAGNHPDHDTIATFRRRFLNELSALFIQVLEVAQEMKLLKLGTISLDGTKIKANASHHSALSYGHIETLQIQLKQEVQELLKLAEQADQSNLPDGMNLPEEIQRREDRLKAMEQAKAKITQRAQARYEREQAQHQARLDARAQQEKTTGKKPRGREPLPPDDTPNPKDQINLTDEQSRIMPISGGGFEQAYNAQAGVDTDSLLVITNSVTQDCNDKQQIQPMLKQFAALPSQIGTVEKLLADTGYFSAQNANACEQAGIDSYIATHRDKHHPHPLDRFSEPSELSEQATPTERMRHKLRTCAGRKLYALRKQTVEPVFGIIKSVMGFRQFSLRGLEGVTGEWSLVCLAWNMKRMASLRLK